MISHIDTYFECVINVLSKPAYNIPETRVSYIKKLFAETNILKSHRTEQIITVILYDYSYNYYGSVKIKNTPQVIDVPPLYINNTLINIIPIMVFSSDFLNESEWVTMHELSHLLSIGEYVLYGKPGTNNQYLYHSFGINQYLYQIKDNKLNILCFEKHNGMNELITDFVTWQLAQTVYSAELEPRYNGIKKIYKYIVNECSKDTSVQEFIGWYFSGNIIKIRKFLLREKYNNYEQLYLDLEKYY